MRNAEQIKAQLMPWTGLVVGIVAAGLAHQIGSEGTFNDCATASPVVVSLVSLLAIAAAMLGAFASWRVVRNTSEGPSRRLVGIISVGVAALVVLTLLLPMIASLVLPPCFG